MLDVVRGSLTLFLEPLSSEMIIVRNQRKRFSKKDERLIHSTSVCVHEL